MVLSSQLSKVFAFRKSAAQVAASPDATFALTFITDQFDACAQYWRITFVPCYKMAVMSPHIHK